MLRRSLIAAAAPLAISGCQTKTADQVISMVSNDAVLIANGLQGVLTQLGALNLPTLTPAILSSFGNYVGDIKALATALSTTTSTAAAQPTVQKIESYVNSAIAVLAGLPLPPPISTALQAAAILLPVIEIAVGLVVPPSAAPTMTPPTARLVLAAAAAQRK